MKLKNCRVATLFLCVLFFAGIPVKALIQGTFPTTNDPDHLVKAVSPVHINLPTNTIHLKIQKNLSVKTDSVFMQGVSKFRSETPAAADIYKQQLRVTYLGRPTGSRKRQRLYTLRVSAKNGIGRLSSVPRSYFKKMGCGAEHPHDDPAPKSAAINEGLPSTIVQVATLHTYADDAWVAKYGDKAHHEIASIVNTAETLYEKQLGIRFKIVGQSVLQTPITATEAGAVLGEFRNVEATQNDDVDLKHLFTGKEFDGSTIGIAFMSAICWEPKYAYGVSQDFPYAMPNLFAHEIGHNFGARHDTTSFGIMYPLIQPFDDVMFSQVSLNEINAHLLQYGSCLSTEVLGPDLTQAKLSIKRKGRIITGTATYLDTPIPNIPISVVVNKQIRVVKTNQLGKFTYIIPKPKKLTFYKVQAQTANAETKSRTLLFVSK